MAKYDILVTHEDGTKEHLHAHTFGEARSIARATGGASYEIKDSETGETFALEEAHPQA
jgi:hypothetical protein